MGTKVGMSNPTGRCALCLLLMSLIMMDPLKNVLKLVVLEMEPVQQLLWWKNTQSERLQEHRERLTANMDE